MVVNALKYKSAYVAKNKKIMKILKKYRFFNLFISDIKDAYLIKYDNFNLETETIHMENQ